MNTVHEPGPPVTLKYHRSKKSVQKAKPDAQAPSKPSRHAQECTGPPRRAHGCRVVAVSPAVSWQGAGRVAATVPLIPLASARAPAPSAPAPAPARSAYRACCRAPARSSAPPRLRPCRPAPHYLAPHARQPSTPAPACAPSTPACAPCAPSA